MRQHSVFNSKKPDFCCCNRKPFCARWQVSASSEHLAQVPGACLRSWQPARPPHTTRRKTQGEAKVQIWSWMMRQTSCFRSCQTPMTLAQPWVSAGQCCVRIRCRSGRGSAAALPRRTVRRGDSEVVGADVWGWWQRGARLRLGQLAQRRWTSLPGRLGHLCPSARSSSCQQRKQPRSQQFQRRHAAAARSSGGHARRGAAPRITAGEPPCPAAAGDCRGRWRRAGANVQKPP